MQIIYKLIKKLSENEYAAEIVDVVDDDVNIDKFKTEEYIIVPLEICEFEEVDVH